jgi:hypothetical protein
VIFTGVCPFLTCTTSGPHEHAACAECGVLRHSNFFHCRTCHAVFSAERAAAGITDEVPFFGEAS